MSSHPNHIGLEIKGYPYLPSSFVYFQNGYPFLANKTSSNPSDFDHLAKDFDHLTINSTDSPNQSPNKCQTVHSSISDFLKTPSQNNDRGSSGIFQNFSALSPQGRNQSLQGSCDALLEEKGKEAPFITDEENQRVADFNRGGHIEHKSSDILNNPQMKELQKCDKACQVDDDFVKFFENEKLHGAKGPEQAPRNVMRHAFRDQNDGFQWRNIHKKIPNLGLRNLGNSCYINALLQCLYHTERFRDYIMTVREQEGLPILRNLADFFIAMKSDDDQKIYQAQWDLLKKIQEIRLDIEEKAPGDSALLFRSLIEELSFNHEDIRHLPQLEMFAGSDLIKTKTCSKCSKSMKMHESIKILEVRDINFSKINQKNYFQSETETRRCACNSHPQTFTCSYETSKLPEILVIRIQDTVNSMKRVEVLPEIFLREINHYQENGRSGQKIVPYNFLAGVLNQQKGEKGVHSVELSKHGDSYYEFNDFNVWEVDFRDIRYHPKLLFYKRSP